MAKQRFRDIKQSRHKKAVSQNIKQDAKNTYYASCGQKIKAFLTDAFMLLMPIMYIVFYLVMEGREDFATHRVLGWVYILLPFLTVQTLFLYFTGQTPGYRAYNITIIDEKTKRNPSLFIIVFRNLLAILTFFTLFGWIMMFFRKDNKTLHDLLSATALVNKK